MCRSKVDIQSATTEIRQGKKERKKKKQDKNIMSTSAMQVGYNYTACPRKNAPPKYNSVVFEILGKHH